MPRPKKEKDRMKYYALIGEELISIPKVFADELTSKGWVEVQLTDKGEFVIEESNDAPTEAEATQE